MILGLDLSCSTCGYCIATDEKRIIAAGFIDISKIDDYNEKANLISEKVKEFPFKRIQVEENLFGFSFGHSNQKTLIKLIQNKSVICYILGERFKVPVKSFNVNTTRKQLFGKARIKGIKSKEFVKKELDRIGIDLSAFLVTSQRTLKEDKRNEDIRDAVVCALFQP